MILIFPILILPFNFSAFASENLIDSDLRNWENISDINDLYSPITVTYYSKPNVYRLTANGTESGIFAGILFDNTEIISGHNYTLQFEIPSGEYLTANGYSITDNSIKWHYHSAHVTVHLGFIQSDGSLYVDETFPYLQFTADNILQNLGKVCSLTFEADTFSGTPCIAISITNIDNQNQNRIFFFKDFSLIDNTKSEEDNFFSRLFEWFENKFKQLFNVLLYLDPDGEQDYNNPFAPNDTNVNGADNLEYLQNGINKFVDSVENLTLYLRVPSEMLTTLGDRFPIIPIIVVFTLVGLVVMRLFGVRRDS